jgi:hypothetical protein
MISWRYNLTNKRLCHAITIILSDHKQNTAMDIIYVNVKLNDNRNKELVYRKETKY